MMHVARLLVLSLILGSTCILTTRVSASGGDCQRIIDAHYPRQYVAYERGPGEAPPTMDGRLDEPFWQDVPFTEDFVDISTETKPRFQTKAKVRWDTEWIYVGVYMEEPAVWANITHTCHCIDPHEDQVIFHDNDIEVFFDVDGTCHWYKEYEMNAANATWDLLLNAPYENGGYENSSRVYGSHGFDMVPPLRSSVFIDGILNDPSSNPRYWSVEVQFPVAKLLYHTRLEASGQTAPKDKQFWRINFSRVEWAVRVVENRYEKFPSCQSCPTPGAKACDNWAWSPMYAVDMHHPEMWGILQFSSEPPNTTRPVYDVEWPTRYVAHELYYAQVGYYGAYQRYASKVTDLRPFAHYNATLDESCTGPITIWANASAYLALIPDRAHPLALSIDHNREMLVHRFH